jgi:hypothetical protein
MIFGRVANEIGESVANGRALYDGAAYGACLDQADAAGCSETQRFAYSGNQSWLRRPLQIMSRWRVERKMYAMPLEKTLIERLRPGQALS